MQDNKASQSSKKTSENNFSQLPLTRRPQAYGSSSRTRPDCLKRCEGPSCAKGRYYQSHARGPQGFEGKISRVDLKNYHVYVEGLTREKVDGTTIFVSIHPSKIMIKTLNLDDKWRKAVVKENRHCGRKRSRRCPKGRGKEEKPVEEGCKSRRSQTQIAG